MSGTQSTLTDRTPNILNKEPADKKTRNDKSSVSIKHEFDPTGLVQRCVIIQRDENGFGLTVSGDNPVFVQLVKEDGAAMRAGVQTGDRIIKVNGTLVTHSNHIEVVKLIRSGSYVALTVLGRPPGLSQIPLEEEEPEEDEDEEEKEDGDATQMSAGELRSSWTCGAQEAGPSPAQEPVEPGRVAGTTCSRPAAPRWVRTLSGSTGFSRGLRAQAEAEPERGTPLVQMCVGLLPEGPVRSATPRQSPIMKRGDAPSFGPDEDSAPETEVQSAAGSPPYLIHPLIIGAEDDYFDSQQEQVNSQCSCFQNMDLLKARPAHLAVFLHHVVSQFDPAPLLCFLFADLHKQTSSKESRRFFLEFHSLFMDRSANLKVPVPDSVSSELERRRLELIPEEVCKQYTQMLQDTLLPDLHKNLEDFRHKRSMGLTLAEDELSRLDWDGAKDQQNLDRECSCAEHVLSKIEDILLTSQPTEEEKSQTMQYVILTYMKHLGVKVKEPRGLEQKRARINFLPKIKKSIKPEKEGEEKVKKPRFPNILGPPRRLTRVDSTSVNKAVELNRQRSPKLLPQPAPVVLEQCDSAPSGSGRGRAPPPAEAPDAGAAVLPLSGGPAPGPASGPAPGSPAVQKVDAGVQEWDCNVSPPPRPPDAPPTPPHQDGASGPTQFDFSPSNLEQLQEEDQETFRTEVQAASSPGDVQSEEDLVVEAEGEEEPLNWQSLVGRGVLETLTPLEIKRQEVINELFYTERAHLRKLRVMDSVFYQRLNRDAVLPPEDIRNIFTNLEEILQLHVSITEQMSSIRRRSETSVIGQIGDDLLSWFGGEEEEKVQRAVGTFCSNQPSALELIKSRRKKDQRFTSFMQEAERNRLCRRQQLKDIIPVEMQRFTKYPLLLENIAKYTEDEEDKEKVRRAGECCKKILNHVNQAVKEAENKQRLEDYQRRLDVSSLKPSENPVILELKNLDLTKRKMVHEGPLAWRVNKEKTIELYTILLEDILVLLQKQDERLVLKFHVKNVASAMDTKHIFSPVIKLNTVLVRPVATDTKAFFVLSMSENGPQIYQLKARTVSDQRTWQCLITQRAEAMKAQPHGGDVPPPPPSEAESDAMEIMNGGISKPRTEVHGSSGQNLLASDFPSPANPFDGLKSEDEEEELSAVERREVEVQVEEEEEVDEEELEAFLDGRLVDPLPLLQERSRRGIALENHGDPSAFDASKAEEALRTLVALKQLVFNHVMSREMEEMEKMEDEEEEGRSDLDGTSSHREEPPPGSTPPITSEGSFLVLDLDGHVHGDGVDEVDEVDEDAAVDMRKLLSSSSQAGGGGPDLQRQLRTHLRLLQTDLQYLKEVELKYEELRQTLDDPVVVHRGEPDRW